MNPFIRMSAALVVAGLAIGVSATADAAVVYGTQAFADVGTPTLLGTPTGDINLATGFQFGSLVTTTSQTGSFVGVMAAQSSTPATAFLLATPTSFALDSISSPLGVFNASTASQVAASGVSRSFVLTGTFTPGTAFGTGNVPEFARMALGFTQVGGAGGAISVSASLVVLAVPEPASAVMLGLGLAGLGGVSAYRRRRLA